MALPELCWCGHCGASRRLRDEGEFASCSACGKILLERRGGDAAALPPARRRRRRTEDGAVGHGDAGAKSRRGEVSDAESGVTSS
ncbi:unnamed protein product [Urochloa decumbens]|uniref:Uncharacterized protein n=1 Tax=Urochloa decumbens TaxID=240449 RepID=A0ABC9GIQ8_9POAL